MRNQWKHVAVLALVSFQCVIAQTTGVIRGTVKDPSGAVIGGAKITTILQATNATRTAISDIRGEYVFPTLPVGKYTVEIEATGFKKYSNRDLDVTIGHVIIVDAPLELGEISQVITADAKAPLVETSSTQLGAVVNETTVTNLPLNARDTYQLLQLQPGVQSQQGYDLFAGSERAGVVSVNGGRGRSNNFNVNGGDGNDQFIGVPAIQPSPDTIQEFRVLTNTFDAEYGRNSGAVVNVVTKGGTNEFHGNLYEFFRNRALNTRGFFDSEKPDFKQNQYGGTFGGPIKKNRTFFFGSYEARRIVQGISSDLVTVPTAAERTGDFSAGSTFYGALSTDYTAGILNARPGCAGAVAAGGGAPIASGTDYASIFPGNKIPTACFDPTAVDLMNQFVPLANRGDSQYQSVPGQRDRDHQGTLRIDHMINDSQQLNFYYYADDDALGKPFSRFQAAGANVPGFGSEYDQRVQQWNISHTWTLNATSVNEFRFAYFREGQKTFNHPQRTNLVQDSCKTVPAEQCFSDAANPKFGITPGLGAAREGVPFINVSGGFTIGNNSEGELPQVGNSFHWADNFSKVVGSHTFKFGADIRRQRFDQTLYFDVNGNYGYYGGGPNDVGFDNLFPNYLLGLPDGYVQGSAQSENVRSTSIYLYAQDSWKIKPSLTLNYGLRWELNTPITEIGKRVQTYRPGQNTSIYPCKLDAGNPLVEAFGTTDCSPGSAGESVFPQGLVVPGDQGVPAALTQTYYKSFAPRIGLAWSPSATSGWLSKLLGGPGRTSIRMGWGMFYNPVEQLVLEQFSAEPPFGGSSSFTNVLFNTPFVGQDGTENPNPFNGILNPPRGQTVDWSRFRPILLYGQFQPRLRSQYSEQYNFTIQREIINNLMVQVGYVGTQGHRLLATHDLNYGNAQSCLDLNALSTVANDPDLACGPYYADSSFDIAAGEIPTGFTLHLPYGSVKSVTGPNANPISLVGLRPYSSPLCEPTTGVGCPPDGVPVFSSIFAQDTISNSSYNSFQANVEKRFAKGFSFQGAYTFSKSIDNASSFESILNPLDYRRSRSLSMFDARQRFVFSYYYLLPTFNLKGAAAKLLNGWGTSGIVTFQGGFPVRIISLDDLELMYSYDFELPGEPDLVGKFRRLNPRGPGNYAFNQDAFAPQAMGTIGSSPRTVCCGPGIDNFDIGLHKEMPIHERIRLEFRAEFFNIFNHAQFSKVDGNITDGVDFGRVTRARDPRLIQFALKLFF